jgi:hypothetical protein
MTSYTMATPPGYRNFVRDGELYLQRLPSGEAQDAMPPELAYGEPHSISYTPRQAKSNTFDAAAWGRTCTQKALRAIGMDAAETEAEERKEQGWDDTEEDDINSAGRKCFGDQAWDKFRKGFDKRPRRIGKDAPPDFGGKPETGASDAVARATFAARYPGTANVGIDNVGIPARSRPTPAECVARARFAVDGPPKGMPSFEERFPGTAKIKQAW